MAIEQDYLSKIEEIKQHEDQLNDWEKGFMFGDPNAERPSSPIEQRPELSISQKRIIDGMYNEKVKGADRAPVTEVKFDKSDRVIAHKLETNAFQVSIDNNQVGPGISSKEAIAIVGWLAEVIDELVPAVATNSDDGFPGE